MFENPNETPVAPAAPVASSNPPAAPEVVTAEAGTPPGFDVKAFDQLLKRNFGPDWSVDNVTDKLTEHRKGFSLQGKELSEFKRKYTEMQQQAGPFMEAMKDQNFAAGVGDFVQNYFAQQAQQPTMQGYSPQYAAPLSGFDPVLQRVQEMENQLRSTQLTQQLNDLVSHNFPLTQEMADQLIERYNDPNVGKLGSARDHYMVLFGDRVIELREQMAAKAAVEAVQKNNSSYTPGPATSTTSVPSIPAVDFSKMSPEQFDAYARQRAEVVLGGMRK